MKDRFLKFKSQNIDRYEFIRKENLRGIDKAVEAKIIKKKNEFDKSCFSFSLLFYSFHKQSFLKSNSSNVKIVIRFFRFLYLFC